MDMTRSVGGAPAVVEAGRDGLEPRRPRSAQSAWTTSVPATVHRTANADGGAHEEPRGRLGVPAPAGARRPRRRATAMPSSARM